MTGFEDERADVAFYLRRGLSPGVTPAPRPAGFAEPRARWSCRMERLFGPRAWRIR
jgi:hypothetical protein